VRLFLNFQKGENVMAKKHIDSKAEERVSAQPRLHQRAREIQAYELDDDGTNDLVISDVLRTNELQVWFLSEHLVDVPLVKAKERSAAAAGA
jgi:hypothetical protein